MKSKSLNTKFIYCYSFISLFPLLVNYIWIIRDKNYKSEFPFVGVQLDNITITFCLISLLFFFFVCLCLILGLQKKRWSFLSRCSFFLNQEKVEKWLFFFSIIKIIFVLLTGIGKAGTVKSSSLSTVINLFNFDFLFYYYYLLYRENVTRNFILISILFCLYQLLCGWTGFVLSFVIIELYVRSFKKGFFKYLLIMPFIFFFGGLFYQFLYPFKNFIRLGFFEAINYFESLEKLFERMTFFSHSCVGVQNSEEIINLYYQYGYNFTEIKDFFRPIVPSFLMEKDFRNLNNLIMQSVYPTIQSTTSSNIGGIFYLYILFKISCIDFVLYWVFFAILGLVYKLIVDLIVPIGRKKYYTSCLIFIYFMNFFKGGNLVNLYYGWFSIILTFFIMWCLGVLRIRRNK